MAVAGCSIEAEPITRTVPHRRVYILMLFRFSASQAFRCSSALLCSTCHNSSIFWPQSLIPLHHHSQKTPLQQHSMEFTKCQGCQLLTSLPSAARATLVHFEVVAVLAPFHIQPRFLPTSPAAASASAGGGGGVPHKCFVYGVVTDWSLLLLSMPSAASAPTLLLELPLLMLQSMVRTRVCDECMGWCWGEHLTNVCMPANCSRCMRGRGWCVRVEACCASTCPTQRAVVLSHTSLPVAAAAAAVVTSSPAGVPCWCECWRCCERQEG